MKVRLGRAVALLLGCLSGTVALAHPGHVEGGGFAEGLMHPWTGADHLLAMLAVGMLAAWVGGAARWRLPLAFLSMMAAGSLLALPGLGSGLIEAGVALSLVVIGALLAHGRGLPQQALLLLVGFFALFHGAAHGAELPHGAAFSQYFGGFILSTAALHALGLVLGQGASARLGRFREGSARAIGWAVAVVGVALLVV